MVAARKFPRGKYVSTDRVTKPGFSIGRRLATGATCLVAAIGLGAMVGVSAAATSAGASPKVVSAPHASAAGCTFKDGSQSATGSLQSPAPLSNVKNGDSISVTCPGLDPNSTYGIFQASPLAVVTQPFSISVLGSEADILGGLPTLLPPDASGTYTNSLTIGTTAAGTFTPGGAIGTTVFTPDPNAQCPPSQAEINAGLSTCVIAVDDISATTGGGAGSQADFAGEALLDFSGQSTPAVPPSISFNPPVVAPGHSAILTDAGSSANWWAGAWWAGGYSNGSLVANPYQVPASNVLVDGKQPSSSSVEISPAVYCFYGGSSSTSCNAGTADTPGAGIIFPSEISGSVAISSSSGAAATVSVYEPNVWGSLFPGNNKNSAYPANDLTGSGSVAVTHTGYWEVASDGGVFSFGTANFYGSMGGQTLDAPIVGIASTPDGGGYWEVASDGGIFAFGNAQFYGSMGGQPLNAPIVGIASTPDGGGYWEVASDGGIFAFGNASFQGSMGGVPLNAPVVSIAPTQDGAGYWEVASDGGVFSFGDAQYYGSIGGKVVGDPVIGLEATTDGGGYYEVANDGGVFAFGDAPFYGSMGGLPLNAPIVDMWITSNGHGYWEEASDGGIFSFGNAAFLGSMGGQSLNKPIVGGALTAIAPTSSLTLAKSTTSKGYGAAGNVVEYNYLVTNTGQAALSEVRVTDNKNSVSCPSATLAKGASETCTGSYKVVQSDVDTGSVTNTATAYGVGFQGVSVASSPEAVTVLASKAAPAMTLTETTPSIGGYGAAGEVIDFFYAAKDTGTTSLTNIAVTDGITNLNGDTEPVTVVCPSGTIAPGQSLMCFASYTISQDDVDFSPLTTGNVPNPQGSSFTGFEGAQATATTLLEAPIFATGAPLTVGATFATAGVTLVKTSDKDSSGFSGVGDTITYTYTYTNSGTISLTNVGVVDSVAGSTTTFDATCGDSGNVLLPEQSDTCTATYTPTQADVTAGEVTNNAVVTAYDLLNFNPWQAPATDTVEYSGS
jgi:uncharacterized repeat protein (TIGR01451 family)